MGNSPRETREHVADAELLLRFRMLTGLPRGCRVAGVVHQAWHPLPRWMVELVQC
jgi:hypothetical protein